MPTKPTEDVFWAEGASPIVSEPSVQRSNGFPVGYIPPAGQHNWLFRGAGRWLRWLARSAGFYSAPQTTQAGIFPLGSGDTFVFGGQDFPGFELTLDTTDNGQDWMTSMDHDGNFIVFAEQGDGAANEQQVFVFDPTFTTLVRKWDTGNNGGDLAAIACNGTYIAVGRTGGEVEVFDYDGNSQFTADLNATLVDLAMDNDRLYIAGNAGIATPGGTNAREVVAYTLSTGAFAWEMDAAKAQITSIRTDGDFVYIAGAVFGGDHLWRLVASTGVTDAAGSTTDPVTGSRGRLALGPDSLYVVTRNGGTDTLREFNKNHVSPAGTFNEISSVSMVVNTVGGIDADDRYVYVHDGTRLHALPIGRELSDKYAGWNLETDFNYFVTSGTHVYGIDNTVGPPRQMRQVSTGRPAGIWRYTGDNPPNRHWFRRRFIPGV